MVRAEFDRAGVVVVCRLSVSTTDRPAVVRSSTASAKRRTGKHAEHMNLDGEIFTLKMVFLLPFGAFSRQNSYFTNAVIPLL